MTTNAILPIYQPVLHQSWARKRMVPLAHIHLEGADWYLTIIWQLSLLAKENKPELTKTKYVPQFEKFKRSQQILSRDVHWRKNLLVWDCSSKKALATSKQSWSWIQLFQIGCLPGKRRWISSGISWGNTSVGKKLEVFIFLVLLELEKLPA